MAVASCMSSRRARALKRSLNALKASTIKKVGGSAAIGTKRWQRQVVKSRSAITANNAWADDQGLRVYFIDLGKSKQKASLESVDGGFWDGCLNQLGFNGIARHVKSQRVGSRLKKQRCGSRLKCKTPEVFAAAGSFVYRVET